MWLLSLAACVSLLFVADVRSYAGMLRGYRCSENLREGMLAMSYAAEADPSRTVEVRRASDNALLACGVDQFTPGETLLVQLSPVANVKTAVYAEHLLELRSVESGEFVDAGCGGRRVAGQYHVSNTGESESSTATVRTLADAKAPITIVAGWQRTLGPVRISPACTITAVGGDAAAESGVPAPRSTPSPMPRRGEHDDL